MILMDDTQKTVEAGLYKLENGEVLFAPNYVIGPGLKLKASKTIVNVKGWSWFSSRAAAETAYGLKSVDSTYCGRIDCPMRVQEGESYE